MNNSNDGGVCLSALKEIEKKISDTAECNKPYMSQKINT